MAGIARTSTVGAAQWSVDSVEVADADGTVLLASADPQRAAVTVMNDPDSSSTLYVVPDARTRKAGGIPVPAGGGVVVASVAPVYGYVKAGGRATAHMLAESGVVC